MLLLLLSLASAPCKPAADLSCTCVPRTDPRTVAETRRDLPAMGVVFTGRVLHTRSRRDSIRVKSAEGDSTWFRIWTVLATVANEMVWKGPIPDTVQVETNLETAACGAGLREGERYLISAGRVSPSVLITSKCGWTRPLSEATELLALLREAT